jgi:hypothetical protein
LILWRRNTPVGPNIVVGRPEFEGSYLRLVYNAPTPPCSERVATHA